MIPVRSILPFLLFVTSFACRSSPEVPAAPPDSGTGIELFTTPAQGLHVDADLALGELLARYTGLMGWTLEASDELRKGLATWHCYFDRALDIPPARVHAFVESMLRSHGFFLEFAHAAQPVVLRVITAGSKTNLTRVIVPAAEVQRWGEHPAYFIAADVELTGDDAKQLAASLHFVFSEPELVRIVQVDKEDRLAVSGPGTDIASLLRIVSNIDGRGSRPVVLPEAQRQATGLLDLLHDPMATLHLESDSKQGLSIEELLEQYAKLMGWHLMLSPDVHDGAKSSRTGLTTAIDVPKEDVHAFVEGMLRSYGFVLRFAQVEEPIVLEVGNVHLASSGPRPSLAPFVQADELAHWARHPCFLIQTQLRLPGVDVSALSNSLRGQFLEVTAQRIVPLGAEQLLVTGFGADIAQLMPVFRTLVENAAGTQTVTPNIASTSEVLELFAKPANGLHFEKPKRGELKVDDVIEQYAQVMGWRLLVDFDTRNQMRGSACSFALPLDVPAERVHAFVEGFAQANQLLFSFAHAKDPVLLQVQSLNVAGRGSPRRDARVVSASELQRWSPHRAFLVSTLVDLPGVDVRTLSNSLRQMFSDQQYQQIIPLGNSNGLLVTGIGSEVAALATLFHSLAESAAGVHIPLPAPSSGPSVLEVLVTPTQALHLAKPENGEPKLLALVEAYTQLMGWRVLVGPDTANMLRTVGCGFAAPVDVPAEHVHAFVEGVLRANDFVLRIAHAQEPVLLELECTNVAGKGNPRKDAVMVPVVDLPRWAAHPDFLITTCIDLPGVDVRTLSNSMRQMFSDQQTQQIIPVGNTDGLIVTGFGSDVSDIATMLGSLSAAAAGTHVPLPATPDARSDIGLLVTPPKGLHFEKQEGHELRLIDVFDQYCQLMGWRVLAGTDTRNQLITLKCAISLPLDVPPENVHSFVESIARANDFVLTFAHTRDPVLLAIASTNIAGRGNCRKDATIVPASELSRWAAHPAFLITTTIDLPGIDVRTLSNSLRQLFSDQQTQQIVPLGNTDGLILTGFGSDIATLAGSLGELSRGGAGLQPPILPPPPTADRARLFPLGMGNFSIPAPDGKEAAPIDVLEEFSSWTKRPLEISEDARKALVATERKFAEPRVVPAQLAYPCVGLLLERAHCTLSPAPPDAPAKWVVDVTRSAKGLAAPDIPAIPFEELAAWSAYCATPFRTILKLPDSADAKQVDAVLKIVSVGGGVGCRVDVASNRALQLCGTPLEIQATAYAILQACEPAPTGR